MTRKKMFIAVLGILFLGNMPGYAATIHDAARKGDVAAIESLLAEKPERIIAKDENGATPLIWAAYEGHKDVAELLIAKGADVNAKDKDGHTPLSIKTRTLYNEIADLLRKHGAK